MCVHEGRVKKEGKRKREESKNIFLVITNGYLRAIFQISHSMLPLFILLLILGCIEKNLKQRQFHLSFHCQQYHVYPLGYLESHQQYFLFVCLGTTGA